MSERYDENEAIRTNFHELREGDLKQRIRAIKNETRILNRQKQDLAKQLLETKQDLAKLKRAPLIIANIVEYLPDTDQVIIRSSTGPQFVASYADNIDKADLLPNVTVALNQRYLSIVRILPSSQDPLIKGMEVEYRPKISFENIGGLSKQMYEIAEAIELSLTKPELFEKIGIEGPKGVLLFGPPGNGKTLIAKAIAAQTKATFIKVNGPELVQKYIGEGARLIRELFQFARKKAPSIIFIDELDAIGARRSDISTSGDREVQRTFMQLLSELDGFRTREDVKIIGSTNRPDILDPALLRPGRFDRHIEIPLPDTNARVEILRIHTKDLNIKKGLDLEIFAAQMEGFSGADIRAVCQEAGLITIRAKRVRVKDSDFVEAIEKIRKKIKKDSNTNNYTFN